MPGVVITLPTQRLAHHIITIVAFIVNRGAPQRFPMRTPLIPQPPTPARRLASSPALIAMANRTRWVTAPRSSRGARTHTMHRADRRRGHGDKHRRMRPHRVGHPVACTAHPRGDQLPGVGGIQIRARRAHTGPPILTPRQHRVLAASPVGPDQMHRAGAKPAPADLQPPAVEPR